MRDLYLEVTDRIIASFAQGTPPWAWPWNVQPGISYLPHNFISGRQYRGINVFLLLHAQIERGFISREWLTFDQARKNGAAIRKGEKGTHIYFYKLTEFKGGQDIEDVHNHASSIQVLKSFVVFNRNQVKGLAEKVVRVDANRQCNDAEEIINQCGARTFFGGDRASYNRHGDYIRMPEKATFDDDGSYYATYFHELTHWTGHLSRLSRTFGQKRGDSDYAREELVAEMGAAFLCAELGIVGNHQYPGYITEWLRVLQNDKRAVIQAASAAQKACDHIMGRFEYQRATKAA